MVDPQDCERVSDVTDVDACVDDLESEAYIGKVPDTLKGGLAGLQASFESRPGGRWLLCLSLTRRRSSVSRAAGEGPPARRRRGGDCISRWLLAFAAVAWSLAVFGASVSIRSLAIFWLESRCTCSSSSTCCKNKCHTLQ